ncbi:MAG: RES family NAD+ phosphorylase [Bryobacteraceae bacterium]
MEEPFLRAKIEMDGLSETCSYCEQEGNTFSIDQIADSVAAIFADVYRLTEAPEGRSVVTLIKNLAGLDEPAADDVRCVLKERRANEHLEIGVEDDSFDTGSRYTRSVDAWEFDWQWRRFEESLKTETRYFNRETEEVLTSIFDGIDRYHTITGRPVVAEAGPGTDLAELYRARIFFQAEGDLREAMKRPDLAIGPPPCSKAVAGRLNATGISVFYGATHPDVALAEVRPPVGSKVLIGCFEVVQPLKLLDLVAIADLADEDGSLFDEDYRARLKRAQFLRGLGRRLSKPVMPNDEPLEYLPTQAVADFLASAATLSLDGIVYPSVQNGHGHRRYGLFGAGRYRYHCNVVLFHKTARVQQLDEGADISISDDSFVSYLLPDVPDNRPDVRYTVQVANAKTDPPTDNVGDAALRFSSLEVHYVRGVRFETESSSIPRYLEQNGEGNDGPNT